MIAAAVRVVGFQAIQRRIAKSAVYPDEPLVSQTPCSLDRPAGRFIYLPQDRMISASVSLPSVSAQCL